MLHIDDIAMSYDYGYSRVYTISLFQSTDQDTSGQLTEHYKDAPTRSTSELAKILKFMGHNLFITQSQHSFTTKAFWDFNRSLKNTLDLCKGRNGLTLLIQFASSTVMTLQSLILTSLSSRCWFGDRGELIFTFYVLEFQAQNWLWETSIL